MSARSRASLMALGLCLPGCLELGGSWDPSAATSATTTASSSTSSTTKGTTGARTTGTAGTGTMGTTTEGCGFLGCEDMEGESEECDAWAQDCAEGFKCMPYASDGSSSWNATKCSPVQPRPDDVGDLCTARDNGLSGMDSCGPDALCNFVDPQTMTGVCYRFCLGSLYEPYCPSGSVCQTNAWGAYGLCIPECDPLFQDCLGDDLCLPIDGHWICVFDASGEMGAYGDPCEYANACDPGLVCLNPEYVPKCEAGGCCSPFCDTTAPNTCPGEGQVCIPWYEEGEAPPGFETVGVCGVPQP